MEDYITTEYNMMLVALEKQLNTKQSSMAGTVSPPVATANTTTLATANTQTTAAAAPITSRARSSAPTTTRATTTTARPSGVSY